MSVTSTFNNQYISTTILLLILIVLSSCEKPPRDWEIEYDDKIPGLHGEIFQFNKPVLYVVIDPSDSVKGYTPIEISLGKLVSTKMYITAFDNNSDVIEINQDMYFKVLRSFWIRKDWWTSIFVEDLHLAVLEDSNGIKSYTYMITLAQDTNRPDFKTLLDEY